MSCVIVGGGPAGAVLALILARAGVRVTLLEKHADFLRDFRGDTIHPSTLRVLDELGLAERFHRLPHRKVSTLRVWTDRGAKDLVSLRDLPGPYRYIALVPQWDFLTLVTEAAKECPSFRLIMRAEAYALIHEEGVVRGVRYRTPEGEHEIRASLVVAADGRRSALRAAAGLRPEELGAPMDVLWFRLSRQSADTDESFLRLSTGRLMVAINRESYWQLAYIIPKDGFGELAAEGVEALRASVAELLPFLAGRLGELRGLADVSVLTVAVNRLRRWHVPGLLCVGDAAHAMSPVFGVGINLAVQDAVAAANLLAGSLRSGAPIPGATLDLVRRRRLWPTRVTQFAQVVTQNRVISPALGGRPLIPPDLSRLPVLGRLAGRLLGLGVRPEHVAAALRRPCGEGRFS